MLDLFGIVVSSVIMLVVILRAIQIDATQPWFQPPKTSVDSSGLRLQPNSQGGNTAGTQTRGEARRER
jgi:hypothetical protein